MPRSPGTRLGSSNMFIIVNLPLLDHTSNHETKKRICHSPSDGTDEKASTAFGEYPGYPGRLKNSWNM